MAIPSEYFRRLILHNEVFGTAFEFVGVHRHAVEGWQIVTSHPYIAGGPASDDDISEFMDAFGFVPLAEHHVRIDTFQNTAWFRERDGILVSDAAPRNFKKTRDGYVVPIDLVVQACPGLGEFIDLEE